MEKIWIKDGAFTVLNEESMKELNEEQVKTYLKEFQEYQLKKGQENAKEIEALKGQVSEMETVKKELSEIGAELKGVKEKANKSEITTRAKAIANQLIENKEMFEKLGKGESVKIVVKAPATMTTAAVSGSTINPALSNEHLPGFVLIAERDPFIEDFVDFGSTSSRTITWTEEANPEGDAAFIGEGVIKPLLDFEIVTDDSVAKKVADKIKVSTEMLMDVDFMAAEIDRRLRKKHDLVREDGILNGDGTGDNLLGITQTAAAYIGSNPLSETVVDATNFDVIRAAISQIVNSSDGAYYPNVCFVNQYDGAAMDLAKASDGHYVMPPFVVSTAQGDVTIKGVRIVEKTKIPQGYFLIGDMSKSHVREYMPFTATIGYVNDDFEKNLVTIIGESRLHHFIASNEATAFVYDQFATVIADLDPDVA